MRKLMIVAALVLSEPLASAAHAGLTRADMAAMNAINFELIDAHKALLYLAKGTPFESPSQSCYAYAADSAGGLSDDVDELSTLVEVAILMRHQDDTVTVEELVAVDATKVVKIAGADEEYLYQLQGSCSQDNLVVTKLNSLLALIGRAKHLATGLKGHLHKVDPSTR